MSHPNNDDNNPFFDVRFQKPNMYSLCLASHLYIWEILADSFVFQAYTLNELSLYYCYSYSLEMWISFFLTKDPLISTPS